MGRRIYNSVLCILVLSVSLWAQRGGMGGGHGFGAGGHAVGGHAGMGAGSHPSSGGHPVSTGHGGWNNGGHGNGGHGNGWHGGSGFHGNGIRNPYWFRARYAYPYYGYYGYGYGYPYWGWSDFDSGSDNGYSNEAYAPEYSQYPMYADVRSQPGPPSATYASRDEVLQIESEVRRLKEQKTRAFASITPPSDEPQTALIFRDGHTENVRNYAIAGNTLWVLDQAHARKVPLGNIDLPATRQQNETRGVKFDTPNTP